MAVTWIIYIWSLIQRLVINPNWTPWHSGLSAPLTSRLDNLDGHQRGWTGWTQTALSTWHTIFARAYSPEDRDKGTVQSWVGADLSLHSLGHMCLSISTLNILWMTRMYTHGISVILTVSLASAWCLVVDPQTHFLSGQIQQWFPHESLD